MDKNNMEILTECRRVGETLEELWQQRLVYKSLAEKCTTHYSLAPAHTNADQNKVAAIHRLVEVDRAINEWTLQHVRLKKEATKVIALVDDERLKQILVRRYVRGLSWKTIAEIMMMEGKHISIRHLLRLHNQAMTLLADYDLNGKDFDVAL